MAKETTPASKDTSPKTTAKKTTSRASSTSKSGASKAATSKSAASKAAESTSTAPEKDVVTPSAMKKDVTEAKKPMPEVAKEPDPATLPPEEKQKTEPVAEAPKPATPEPQPAKPEPARQPVAERSSGSIFWPLLLGGLVAGIIGFVASELNLFNTRSADDTLRTDLADQETRIAALEGAEAPEVDLSALDDLSEQVSGLNQQIADQEGRIAELEERLTAIEELPASEGGDGVSAAAIAAYERELATLQASVEEMIANARSVEEATASAAREARVRQAISAITAAISTGQPFPDAAASVGEGDDETVPEALAENADSGVATVASLQERFDAAARDALAAARDAGEVEGETGLGGFLRRQLDARSVAPRDGDDPDAILSRADAAVRNGLIGDALVELDALPEEAKAAMADWLNDARARADVEAAVQDLSQSLSAN